MLRSRLALLLLGLVLASLPARAETPAPAPPAAPPAATSPDLFAVAWQQTSAEYKGLCLQAYKAAGQSLRDLVRLAPYEYVGNKPMLNLLVRHSDGKMTWEKRPVAVVMDLDETVIDNSGYQAWLIQAGQKFSPETWTAWCNFQADTPAAQRSVPGALEFIKDAENQGVTVIYVSNRTEAERAATERLLKAYGVSTEGLADRLLVAQDEKTEEAATARMLQALGATAASPQGQRLTANYNDKIRRQMEALSRYQVVAFFGDNLYDFPVDVRKGTEPGKAMFSARDGAVVDHESHWGTDWFVLPNPMYGSWNSSKTIPKGKMVESLDDYGFGASLKK